MAISIAKIPDSIFREYSNKNAEMLEEAILNGILLPDDATNGDVIQNICSMWIEYHDTDIEVTVAKKVWNAPYKAGDTDGNS